MAWNNQTWGFLKWGELGDAFVDVSNPNNVPWGGDKWGFGEWNNGEAMSMSLNNDGVIVTGEVNVGWGSDTWGTETWGESGNVHQVTGLAMTAAEGSSGISINGDSSLIATGNSLTVSAPPTVEAFSAFVAEPTGLSMVAQLTFDPAFAQPGGISMSFNLGTVVADNITIAEVAAKSASTWGHSSWGFGVYGNQPVNTLVMAMSENFSGVDPAPDATLTGQAMAMFLSNVEVHGDANTSAGDTTMSWGDSTWGNSRWGNGIFNADPNYGQTMTMTLGQETVDLNTPIDVTGISMSITLNSIAEIIPECNVDVTGNALTFALGTATNVLIWNEINTGTAPVDPPGWQEVNTNAA